MPLIDGKYEVISERPVDARQTVFEATAPDGAGVRIVWFDLSPGEEQRFEKYRRAVKRLKRSQRAAVFDVVSRPGAHYVAWRLPGDSRSVPADPELASTLSELGYEPHAADVRQGDGSGRRVGDRRPTVYGLAFDGAELPAPDVSPEASPRAQRPRTVEPAAWLVTTATTLLLSLMAVLLVAGGLAARSNSRLVVIPDLGGLHVNEAAQELNELGLITEPIAVASTEPAGTVLKVEPEAGDQLRPGRTVRVSYALPPGSVTPTEVPRVVARQYPEEVEARLREAGLALGEVARIPAAQPAGLVISQRPAAGSAAGEGSEVDLLVSAGPSERLTFLPDLVGLPLEEARYLARLAGLRPERIIEDEVSSGRAEPGTVIAQSLRPNLPIPGEDAVLRLIVARSGSQGPSGGGLPSFVGLPLEEARELAGNLELRVEEMSDRALPEGVVDQQPAPGGEIPDELTLVVNLHPVPVPRPDVEARVREPEPRELPFRWLIEPGIPEQQARVYATTLEGDTFLVLQDEVVGGDVVSGQWRTSVPGPVRFSLTLNDQPYGGEQLAN